jgi:hypothetical protein
MARFRSRLKLNPDTRCWEWTGAKNNSGYGTIAAADQKLRLGQEAAKLTTHRFSYYMLVGPVPRGEVIRHLCHNKLCCNPKHLTTGSHSENQKDTVEIKGINTQVLSEQDVAFLRNTYAGKRNPRGTVNRLAAEYKVARQTITNAIRGRTFKRTYQNE